MRVKNQIGLSFRGKGGQAGAEEDADGVDQGSKTQCSH